MAKLPSCKTNAKNAIERIAVAKQCTGCSSSYYLL